MKYLPIILILSGCSVIKIPTTTGGSKADGFITMTYTVGSFERAQINWSDVRMRAIKRCQNWGYTAAESYAGSTKRCIYSSPQYGCQQMEISIKYQCIGK
jgi:hypothetical protein